MSERSPYSRVYWSIVDDPKFETIFDNDAHLAAWLRLLLIADQAWPASAHLPTNVRRSSAKVLASVGLVDLTGLRYRVHGLDDERNRRREAATRQRTGRDPEPTQLVPRRDPTGTQMGAQSRAEAEKSKEETRLDEDEQNARGLPNLDKEAMSALEDRTGHTWSQAGERQLAEYDRLVGDHGLLAVCSAFDAVRNGKLLTARQLVWPALRLLEPFPSVNSTVDDAEDAREERSKANSRRIQEQMLARRLEHYRYTGEWDAAWGPKPTDPVPA